MPWLAVGAMLREAGYRTAKATGAPKLLPGLPGNTTAALALPERPGSQHALGQLLLQADATEAHVLVGS